MHLRLRTLVAAFTLAMILGIATTAHAQLCAPGGIVVTNTTACSVDLGLADAGGTVLGWLCPPGNTTIFLPVGFIPTGVKSAGAIIYRFIAPTGCTICFTLASPNPVPICCGTVCFNPAACTITIAPCPAPCAP